MEGDDTEAFGIGVVGVLLGVAATLLAIPLVGAVRYRQFIYDYQGLIGAVLTLLAGLIALWGILRQMKQTQALADKEQERHRYGARTLMPVALSEISSYASECLKGLCLIRPGLDTPLDDQFKPPPKFIARLGAIQSPPRDVILDLKECVLSAPADVQDAISTLVSQLQIQTSRLKAMVETFTTNTAFSDLETTPQRVDERIVDMLALHASASALFDYARRRSEHPEKPNLTNAALNNDIRDGEYPNVYALMSDNDEVRGGVEGNEWTMDELLGDEKAK